MQLQRTGSRTNYLFYHLYSVITNLNCDNAKQVKDLTEINCIIEDSKCIYDMLEEINELNINTINNIDIISSYDFIVSEYMDKENYLTLVDYESDLGVAIWKGGNN